MPDKSNKKAGESLITKTSSICPECNAIIEADVFARDGKVWMRKECKKHGRFEDLYWGSAEMYERAKRFARDGRGLSNPNVTKENPVCPKDCGLCSMHKSHTALANLVLTNRCDLSCWYCFFYAKRLGYVYEPTMPELEEMVKTLVNEKPVACNAIQLSLDGDESVFLKTQDGTIVSEKIGEFVNKMMGKSMVKTYRKPIEYEKTDLSGLEVLSFDENLKTTFRPIKCLIRHKNNQKLFRIETDCGWGISTTGSHSVFVLEDENIIPKAASDIREGDVLLGSLELHLKNKVKEINILKLIEKKRPDVLEKTVICGFPKSKLKYFEKIEKRRISWNSISYDTYINSNKRHGKYMRYFNSIKGKELPIKLKITPEFCRLLGYYIGEGCTYRNGIVFTFSLKEKQILEDFENCVKKVFGKTNIRRRELHGSAVQVYIEGYLYKIFFDIMEAGVSAKEKRVPWIIFNVSDRLKKEFLRAYFKCDGNVKMRKSGFEINHNTVSKELASDLVWLHLNFGVVPKIETSTTKPHMVKKTGQFIRTSSKKIRIVIDGKENLSKVLWYLDGERRRKFKSYISSKERHSPSYLRIPITEKIRLLTQNEVSDVRISHLLKRTKYDKSISKENLREITNFFNNESIEFNNKLNDLSHNTLGFFKVRKITRVKPNSQYVYDISVPETEAFFAGFGPLLAHNTGGEPTLKEDLVDVIKMCKRHGVDHVQLNTNGIRISKDLELLKKVREAGVNTLYLSFDGVTPKTNPKNHWEIPAILDNCRKAEGVGAVLVPTIINSVNDHEIGDMLKFGFKNIDVVRGVNYQPVSLVGRITKAEREKLRITIPDLIRKIEEQTDGQVGKDDFYPVPTPHAITRFVEALTGKAQYDLTSHFACGMATYIFEDGGKMIPLPRFLDVEGLIEYLNEKSDELEKGKSKYVVGAKLLYRLRSFIDKKKTPKGLSIAKMLYNVLRKHDYRALGELQHKSLFVGMMHFQDKYNYDIERVKRCCIHYAMTDGRIVPFCAFNVIPEWYRDKSQHDQGINFDEWERKTGKKLKDDAYKRDVKALSSSALYKKTYADF